jgi:hypothetical protein
MGGISPSRRNQGWRELGSVSQVTGPTIQVPGEATAPGEVAVLDGGDLRVRDDDRLSSLRVEENPIERALVGVKGEKSGGSVTLGRLPFEDENGSVRIESELLDRSRGEHRAVPVREAKVEAGPLAVPEGEAPAAAVGVQVEGRVVGDEEGFPDEGDVGEVAFAETPTVAFVQGEGGVRGGSSMGAVHPVLAGERLAEFGERSEGGEILLERLADASVDHEAEVVEEGEDGGGKGRGERTEEGSTSSHARRTRRLDGRCFISR